MLATKLFIVYMLAVLLTFSYPPQQSVSQFTVTTYTLRPDPYRATQYITHLIDDYNLLVDQYDKLRPDFASTKAYFSLYHEAGNSFRVIVIQTNQYNAQLSLIWIPIKAPQPDVIVDYNNTFRTLFPNMTELTGFYFYIQRNFEFTYNGTVIRQDFIFGIPADDISGDFMQRSHDGNEALPK